MKGEYTDNLPNVLTDRERESQKQDEFVDRSNFARKSELVKDEYFVLTDKDKEDPIFKAFKKMDIAEKREIAPFSKAYHALEVGLCRKCKEWTEVGNSCCGEEYVHVD